MDNSKKSPYRKRLKLLSRWLATHSFWKPRQPDFSFSEEDFFGANMEKAPSLFFLGYYSLHGIDLALRRNGFYAELERRGFTDLEPIMDTHDPFRQRLAIYYQQSDPNHLIAETVLRRKQIALHPPFRCELPQNHFEVLYIEWLCLQDPRKSFTKERPRLPGQQHPGLGLAYRVLEMLIFACKQLALSGISNIPEYFHNAQMYSVSASYINPEFEGKRRAIARDLLAGHSLASASWAIDLNCVLENGRPFQWFTEEQLLPLVKPLHRYFNCPEYEEMVKESEAQYQYQVDEKAWQDKQRVLEKLGVVL